MTEKELSTEEKIQQELSFREFFLFVVFNYLGGKLEIRQEDLLKFFTDGFYYRIEPSEEKFEVEVISREQFQHVLDSTEE